MSKINGLIGFLNEEEMQSIHEGALQILDRVGVVIDHQEALDCLAQSGALVDRDRKLARFSTDLTENAIAKMRHSFDLHTNRGEIKRMPICYTTLYFTTFPRSIHHQFTINCGAAPLRVLDLNGNRRNATLQDMRDSVRLADALTNIDFVGSPCITEDIPADLLPIIAAAELVKNTSKPGGIEAWNPTQIKYISEIASVVQGGKEELAKNPILVSYCGIRSPLCLDNNAAAVFIENLRRGFPQWLYCMPCGGTTAPATMMGVLTQGLAETLVGLVLGYAIAPDAFVSMDVIPSMANMKTASYPLCGPDVIVLQSAMNQLLSQYYQRPGGVHGGRTDACISGVQAGIEKALSMIFPLLTGATGIGNVGMIEGNLTFSYQQLVIDDEIARYIKHIFEGVRGDPSRRALDIIEEVGPGGNFLVHPHTAASYREESWLSPVMERLNYSSWETQEVRGMEAHCMDKARRLLESHKPEPLTEIQVSEIDKIISEAKQEMGY